MPELNTNFQGTLCDDNDSTVSNFETPEITPSTTTPSAEGFDYSSWKPGTREQIDYNLSYRSSKQTVLMWRHIDLINGSFVVKQIRKWT